MKLLPMFVIDTKNYNRFTTMFSDCIMQQVTAFPGQAVNLNVTGVDQLGLHTPVAIYLSDVSLY